MKENFASCLDIILKHEGGYVDHPEDPGGATNMGITIGALSDWLGREASKDEVRELDRETAAQIYKANYWDKVKGDSLPGGVDLIVFDSAVNQGVSAASKILQGAVGTTADGIVGSQTIAATRSKDPLKIIEDVNAERAYRYAGLNRTFHRGWFRRLASVTVASLDMA